MPSEPTATTAALPSPRALLLLLLAALLLGLALRHPLGPAPAPLAQGASHLPHAPPQDLLPLQPPGPGAGVRHALVIAGSIRALRSCLPGVLLALSATASPVDILAHVGPTEAALASPGQDAAALAWLHSQPRTSVVVEDVQGASSLPAEARALIPGYPYTVLGPDNPAPHVLASLYRRWRLLQALERSAAAGNFSYGAVWLVRPDTCLCDGGEVRVDLDALFPRGAALPQGLPWLVGAVAGTLLGLPSGGGGGGGGGGGAGRVRRRSLLGPARGDSAWHASEFVRTQQWLDDGTALGRLEDMRGFLGVFARLDELCGQQGVRFHPETLATASVRAALAAAARASGVVQALDYYASPLLRYCLMRMPDTVPGGGCDTGCQWHQA